MILFLLLMSIPILLLLAAASNDLERWFWRSSVKRYFQDCEINNLKKTPRPSDWNFAIKKMPLKSFGGCDPAIFLEEIGFDLNGDTVEKYKAKKLASQYRVN